MASQVTSSTLNRDSIRASIFDACLQLGALDDDSLVAEWMFKGSSPDAPGDDDRSTIRQESITMGWEDAGMHSEKQHMSFPAKAYAFATKLRQKTRAKSKPSSPPKKTPPDSETIAGTVSSNRQTFFKRTINEQDETLSTPHVNPHFSSTSHKTFFRRKTRSAAEPSDLRRNLQPSIEIHALNRAHGIQPSVSPTSPDSHGVVDCSEDDDWEEVEVPSLPLYPLKNKGINPPPAVLKKKNPSETTTQINEPEGAKARTHLSFSLPRSMFHPSPSKRRNTRTLSLHSTPRPRHSRQNSRSQPTPPQNLPSILLTSPSSPITSHVPTSPTKSHVIISPIVPDPRNPVVSISPNARHLSMGYHNQFFPSTTKPPLPSQQPRAVSYAPLPRPFPSNPSQQRKIPFPTISG